jgi:hypothetical protein
MRKENGLQDQKKVSLCGLDTPHRMVLQKWEDVERIDQVKSQ